MSKSTLERWIRGLAPTPELEAPKCKTCDWELRSGHKPFCNHPESPARPGRGAKRIPSADTRTAPDWCPMRIGVAGK